MKGLKLLNNVYCNEHPNEKLNMVCISGSCPKRGLICNLCKNDPYSLTQPHEDHQSKIVPFKHLIQSLESSFDTFQQIGSSNSLEYQCLRRLEQVRDESLFYLQTMISNLAIFAQQLEEKVIDNYESSKSSIMYRTQTLRKLKKVIQRATIHDMRKEQKYELMDEMRGLVGFIKQNEGLTNKSKYELDINPAVTLARYIQERQNLKINCEVLEDFVKKLDQQGPDRDAELYRLSRKQKKNLKKMRDLDGQVLRQQIDFVKEDEKVIKQSEKHQKLEQKIQEKPKLKAAAHPKKKKQEKYPHLNIESAITELDFEGIKQISKPMKQMVLSFVNSEDQQLKKAPNKEQTADKFKQQEAKTFFSKFVQDEKQETYVSQKLQLSSKMYKLFQGINDEEEKKKVKKDYSPLFSGNFKSVGIKLTRQGKMARQTENQGMVLLQKSLQTCKSISFRISKLRLNIAVGIALIDVVSVNNYSSSLKDLAHGIIGVDQAGLCLFHCNPSENRFKKDFYFQERDIITLTFSEGTLWIEKSATKKNKSMSTLNIPFKIHKNEKKKHFMCAYLGGKDDTVQIL